MTYSSLPKPIWDVRAWFLGLFLGNFAGLLILCGSNPNSRRFLESAFPYSVFGYYMGDLVLWLGPVLGWLVFPAIMTCVAKRLYVLWGLLPILLLLLWVIAGNIIAHHGASMFDPFWAIPTVALLCWAVTCYPIALYRFWRQSRRRSVASISRPKTRSPPPRWIGLTVSLTPVLALIALGGYNFKHTPSFHFNSLSHWNSGSEVRVPLIKHGHSLLVKAWLNGQEALCRVDTGSSTIEWPRNLHVPGRLTDQHNQGCDFLGECVDTQTIVLPHLRIGGYEVTDLPTEMSDSDPGLFSPPPQTHVSEEPLLGNRAFVRTVLTVDYKNAEMILLSPEYDFRQQPRKPGDRILEMGWITGNSAGDWKQSLCGWPAVMASINGASFWCTLDTGWGGSDIGLSKKFVDRHLSIKQAKHSIVSLNAAYGSSPVECFHDLDVKFPCLKPLHVKPISLKIDGLVSPILSRDENNITLGFALMEHYRITIDYGRGYILLEPYPR